MKRFFMTCVAMTLCAFYPALGPIAIQNSDGKTIYYAKINDGEMAVKSGTSKYSGYINIPETVIYSKRPYEVTGILDNAFERCSGLTSVTIPNSVTSIGESAFSGCSGLTSVTIPDGVISIGDYAFAACASLTSMAIGSGVTSIGWYAFQGCSSLTSITVENGNSKYDSRDNCNAIIETASNTLIAGCKDTAIPGSVTSIGYRAFSGCRGLTSVTIPDGVTSIDVGAFLNCNRLTSVTIPGSVTSIGDGAFSGCSSLTSVAIPDGVTSIGNGVFSGCSSLTSVTIPDGVTSFGEQAFFGCSDLTSVTIPQGVTSIGEQAFEGCRSLASVAIQSNLITSKTYDSMFSLKNVFGGQVEKYILGGGVTNIGNYAFYGCSGLTSVIIPNSVSSIGDGAFQNCEYIEKVVSFMTEPPSLNQSFSPSSLKYATLYVPAGTAEKYKAKDGWKDFVHVVEGVPDAVEEVMTERAPMEVYRLDGSKAATMRRGINIVRDRTGMSRKVLMR